MSALHNERGGILIPVLMSVFVMTLLGIALFQVARLGDRLRIDSQTSAQGLEVAEAGLERGLHLLYLEFVCGPDTAAAITDANCRNPPPNPNYIGDNKLARVALTAACPAALLPDGAANFKLLKQNQAFAGGAYTVCVRPHPDAPTDPRQIQIRSLGSLSALTGTVTRIVQTDATAISAGKVLPPFFFSPCTSSCGAGSVTANPVVGNAMFAGSLWAICLTTSCTAFNINNNGGMENNYRDLPTVSATLNGLIPIRFEDGTTVNTLGAALQVNKGAVLLSANSSCLGRQTSSGSSPCPGGRDPNGPLAGVFTSGTWGGIAHAGTCPPLNGGATINGNCNVWTLAQGSFPAGGTTATPLLSDSVVIDSKGYRCFFNPPGATCPNTTDPLPGGTNLGEFFYASSWRIDDTRTTADCDIDNLGDPDRSATTVGPCTTVLTALGTGARPAWAGLTQIGPVSTPINSTACQRLEGVVRQPSIAGTAQGPGTSTTITLATTASATDQFYAGMAVYVTTGTGAGQLRRITDYNGATKVATVTPAWSTTPDGTTKYRLDVIVGGVQAAALGSNTITLDPTASATDQFYKGMIIQLLAGPGAGQIAEISNYAGATKVATVGVNWVTAAVEGNWTTGAGPSAGGPTPDQTGAASNQIILAETGGVPANFIGKVIRLNDNAIPALRQYAVILNYVPGTGLATVDRDWAPAPAAGVTYQFETRYSVQMLSCKLQTASGAFAGWMNRQNSTAQPPDLEPIKPNNRPINLYVKRPAGLAATVPTLKMSVQPAGVATVCLPGSTNSATCYQGQMAVIVDNPSATLAIQIPAHLLPPPAINQSWCDVGTYLCGYAFPANHFMSIMTTGNVQLDGAGVANILATFIAANAGRTAKVTVQSRLAGAGTMIAQQLDTSAATGGQPVTFYQAPWNLNFLPQGSSPVTGALAVVLAANWREIQ